MITYDLIDNISKGNLSKAKEMIQGILDKKAVDSLELQKMNLANDLFSDESEINDGENQWKL